MYVATVSEVHIFTERRRKYKIIFSKRYSGQQNTENTVFAVYSGLFYLFSEARTSTNPKFIWSKCPGKD